MKLAEPGANHTLFKDRNLSTVIHETGHLFDRGAARRRGDPPNAPERLKADLASPRAYVGAEGDAPLTVDQHEYLARIVEAYIREGKSPSVALSGVFSRFKAWLISVYKTDQRPQRRYQRRNPRRLRSPDSHR